MRKRNRNRDDTESAEIGSFARFTVFPNITTVHKYKPNPAMVQMQQSIDLFMI